MAGQSGKGTAGKGSCRLAREATRGSRGRCGQGGAVWPGIARQSGKVALGVLRRGSLWLGSQGEKVKLGRDREGGKAVALSQGHEARRRRLG